MNRFTEIVPLALTPLTPIHIGCGEDFEPTNYVIDGGILYHFEPTGSSIGRSRSSAIDAKRKPAGHRRHPCGPAVFSRKAQRLPARQPIRNSSRGRHRRLVRGPHRSGRSARRGWAQGQQRTRNRAHRAPSLHRHTLPARVEHQGLGAHRVAQRCRSGAAATARPRAYRPARDESVQLENQILGGSFSSDPFRLVEFADAAGANLKSRVVFAVDRRKRPRPDSKEKDLAVAREAIAGGQFRAAHGRNPVQGATGILRPETRPARRKMHWRFRGTRPCLQPLLP